MDRYAKPTGWFYSSDQLQNLEHRDVSVKRLVLRGGSFIELVAARKKHKRTWCSVSELICELNELRDWESGLSSVSLV